MIENETQYEVSKDQLRKFNMAIDWHELMLSALRSQAEELEEQIRWYKEDHP